MYKKLIFFFFSCVLVLCTLLISTIFIVDPNDEYDFLSIEGFNSKKHAYSEKTYKRVMKKLDAGPRNVVIGTSRSDRLNDQMAPSPLINPHIYFNPETVYNLVHKLAPHRLRNIKKLYINIDYHTFKNPSPSEFDFVPTLFKALDVKKIKSSWYTVKSNITKSYHDDFYYDPDGLRHDIVEKKFSMISASTDQIEAERKIRRELQEYNSEQIDYLKKLDQTLKEYNIETFYFLGTVSDFHHACLDFSLMKKLREDLINKAQISFYDLAFVEDISNNQDLFTDTSHLSTRGMQLVFLNPKLSNYLVTKENLDKHLEMIRLLQLATLAKYTR